MLSKKKTDVLNKKQILRYLKKAIILFGKMHKLELELNKLGMKITTFEVDSEDDFLNKS